MQTITTTTTKDGVHLLFIKIHLCMSRAQTASGARQGTQPVLIPFFPSYLKALLPASLFIFMDISIDSSPVQHPSERNMILSSLRDPR